MSVIRKIWIYEKKKHWTLTNLTLTPSAFAFTQRIKTTGIKDSQILDIPIAITAFSGCKLLQTARESGECGGFLPNAGRSVATLAQVAGFRVKQLLRKLVLLQNPYTFLNQNQYHFIFSTLIIITFWKINRVRQYFNAICDYWWMRFA